jgi:hypothetical protein
MRVDVTPCQQEQARCVIDTITSTPSMGNKAAKRAYALPRAGPEGHGRLLHHITDPGHAESGPYSRTLK